MRRLVCGRLTVIGVLMSVVLFGAGSVVAAPEASAQTAVSAPTVTGQPPTGTVGMPYAFAFTVTGDPQPVVDPNGPAVTSAGGFTGPCGSGSTSGPTIGLPPGLTLSGTGVLSGVPTTPGRFTFTPEATNAVQTTVGSQVTITIQPAAARTLTVAGGNTQQTAPATAFGAPLTVRVLDATGTPVVGTTVTFTVLFGSASFPSLSTSTCTAPTATAITDSNGVATAPTLTAGGAAGPVLVSATVTNSDGSSPPPAIFLEWVGGARTSALADLALTVTGPTFPPRGGIGTIRVTVTNRGPAAAGPLAAMLYVPPSLTVLDSHGATQVGPVIVFTAPGLAVGATLSYTVAVTAGATPGRGTIVAATTSLTADPNWYNNFAASWA